VFRKNEFAYQERKKNLCAAAAVKTWTLFFNMRSLYAVVLSLSDPIMEDKISNHAEHEKNKSSTNILSLLEIIK